MKVVSGTAGRVSCWDLPIQLSTRVWRLGTYHLAVFLVRGDHESLLFEVGISSTAPLIMAQLAELGVSPEEIRYVVLTHAHSDHATGGPILLTCLPRAELVMSQASQRHLAKPETSDTFREEDLFTSAAILGQDAVDQLSNSMPAPPENERTLIMEPGDSLHLDGVEMQLLGAEGHVPGGLLGWLPSEGALLGSDSAGFCSLGDPSYPLYFVSYTDYQRNLANLMDQHPDLLGLGHQDCFVGTSAVDFLKRTIDLLAQDHQGIISGLAEGRDEESLAQAIFHRYYREELTIYPPDTILECCRLLVRRSREHEEG
jgi:glyoxylase-like metal-dependent hydrolase (beta-lactamase superfamily II)